MYSGCGGGYLYVVSEEPVPGGVPGEGDEGARRAHLTRRRTQDDRTQDEDGRCAPALSTICVRPTCASWKKPAGWAPVHVLLWSDAVVARPDRQPPKFPQDERQYVLQAIRYVQSVGRIEHSAPRPGARRRSLACHPTSGPWTEARRTPAETRPSARRTGWNTASLHPADLAASRAADVARTIPIRPRPRAPG